MKVYIMNKKIVDITEEKFHSNILEEIGTNFSLI